MSGGISLARQLTAAMTALAIAVVVANTAAFYLVYAALERLKFVTLPPDDYSTVGWDLGITLALCLTGSLLALWIALRLARRIARPLGAVAVAARRIAAGDLSTRVETLGDVSGETALLIADFNTMANRLQRMAEDVTLWNAKIAHELRTPLTILQGRLQGAKDSVFPVDARLVDGLLTQVEGLARLVEDLRSVSLADSGRLDLILEDVDLAVEVEAMAPTLRSMLEPAGFSLELDLKPAPVRADPARIRQAVLALIDNARRHADPCSLRIATSFAADKATLVVTDCGPGLDQDLEEEAFHQFVRGARTTGGSGLGLAIVRGIVSAHGGEICYRRLPGRSAFEVTLPPVT